MDKEKIVQAFDAFEKDKFTDSEEILRKDIKQAINDKLKDELGLKKDPIVSKEEEPEEKEEEGKEEEKEEESAEE